MMFVEYFKVPWLRCLWFGFSPQKAEDPFGFTWATYVDLTSWAMPMGYLALPLALPGFAEDVLFLALLV